MLAPLHPIWGMATLMPEQQDDFMIPTSEECKPAAGATEGGRNSLRGLGAVGEALREAALFAAWARLSR